MKKTILIILSILIIINFNILSKKIINPIDDNAKILIAEAEEMILKYKIEGNQSYLGKARSKIYQLKKLAKNNKFFEAKVIGLNCQLEMAENNFENVDDYISRIERRNKNEEKLYIIKSELEEDKKIKEKILLKGIKNTENSAYLKLYLAHNYFSTGNFIKAVKFYDEVFPKLPDIYKVAYKSMRDLASEFSKNPPNNIETITIFQKKEITIKNMLEMMLNESKLLTVIDIPQSQSIKKTLNSLKENDFFYHLQAENISLNSLLKRKDLAYFFLSLLVKLENNPSLKNKYISTYMMSDSEENNSPIPDVDVNHYFYNAVLVLIEKEILELPDGENFQPENHISGLKLFEIIKKIDDSYLE